MHTFGKENDTEEERENHISEILQLGTTPTFPFRFNTTVRSAASRHEPETSRSCLVSELY